ncbi:Uncharacterized protein DB42_DE00130 [Neochlamydia sp. EPS4]|nr:Uncharacterized protein DB42_DE00130 [Neochlamydia sp. EPS4]
MFILAFLDKLVDAFITNLFVDRKSKRSKKIFLMAFISQEQNHQILLAFWKSLKNITKLTFISRTYSKDVKGWNGQGRGEVKVTKQSHTLLIFDEKGTWHNQQGMQFNFYNIFRWGLDLKACKISLEHLRQGANRPIFLLHLVPSNPHLLSSLNSYFCKQDIYSGKVYFEPFSFQLTWRIKGPHKNEQIAYSYF